MAINGTGVFSMDIDKESKVFTAFAEGFFSMEQGIAFCEDFTKAALECSKYGDYIMIVDAQGVKPSTPQVAEALGNALALYASDEFKFKKRFMLNCASSITQSQAVRLSKNVPGFNTKVTFVDTKEDALKEI
ncbi:hypothetical protein [Ruminiclostridium papyrosolvens]|uniref:STAS domain-containing protein n=1 Tax=Ruminiclostridium papyrosolvens C7 TaxID=1330534 RepID=U4R531_9FIRM|nr:hypothetical protein [Ruminiclostridium papyrosolvens]EPR13027.1 hypothetical protein L323_06810 [Ruminiclostridium papyrosolvens C7]